MAKQIVTQYIGNAAGVAGRSKAAIDIGAGLRRTIEIPCFSEGRVTHLYVKQNGGTNVAFDIELLTSKVPYPVGTAAYNAAAAQNVGAFRAIPKQTQVTLGNALEFWEAYGHSFVNQDQASHTLNERKLYLTIIPNNVVDASKWEVTLVTQSDDSD